jgi:hypothetical protein
MMHCVVVFFVDIFGSEFWLLIYLLLRTERFVGLFCVCRRRGF